MSRILLVLLIPLIVIDGVASLPRGDEPYLGDMGQFLASGRAVLRGQNPYAFVDTGRIFDQPTVGTNLNPPVSLLLFAPLSWIPPAVAIYLWTGLTLALYGGMVWMLWRRYRTRLTPVQLVWACAIGGLWYTVVLGQIYVLVAATATAAWLLLDRPETDRCSAISAGILVGATAALKPNFGIWLALLWLAGQRRVAYAGVLVGVFLTALPAIVFGPAVYLEWNLAQQTEVPMISWWPHNGSLYGLAARLGVPWLAAPSIATSLLALAWWVWRSRPSRPDTNAVALAASVFASPLAWMGYDLFLVPILLSRRWSPPLAAAAACMLVPGWLTWSLAPGPAWAAILVAITSTAPFVLTLIAIIGDQRGDVSAGEAAGRPCRRARRGQTLLDRVRATSAARLARPG